MAIRFIVVATCVALAVGAVANATPSLRAQSGLDGFGFHATKISDASDSHQAYLASLQTEMTQWQAHIQQWSTDATRNGAQMNTEAHRKVDMAWAALKVEWNRLQTSGGGAWAQARVSFDRASQTMRSAWQSLTTSS